VFRPEPFLAISERRLQEGRELVTAKHGDAVEPHGSDETRSGRLPLPKGDVMKTGTNLITGIAIGTGIMYLFDPQEGNRRRARARDEALRLSKTTGRAIQRTGQALEVGYQRAVAESRGAVDKVRRLTVGADRMDDQALASHLSACIGRHTSHPAAIGVSVRDGCATLSGVILAEEVREVLECASGVKGVKAVDNQLEVHAEAGNIPQLQQESRRQRAMRWWQFSPALRIATGAAAAGLVAIVAGRRMMG
jgi:osmotically-inducible protein OsmY